VDHYVTDNDLLTLKEEVKNKIQKEDFS